MTVIEILQKIAVEAQRRLTQLNAGASRFYEISTSGSIVERTQHLREYYTEIGQQLQRAIERLREDAPPTSPPPVQLSSSRS